MAGEQIDSSKTWVFKLSLSAKILLGLLLGAFCGIFFGEMCAPLKVVGDIFVGLLRMTVIPYIIVSLISNLGRLSINQSKRLLYYGGMVLALLWGIGLSLIYLLPFSYPEWQAGSFFSSTIVDPPKQLDILELFIPANIFVSLYENQIPAVVVLCMAIGLALSTVKNKDALIAPLDVLSKALIKISSAIAKLAPYGVFAISASAAGTVSLNELGRLQAYLLSYTAGCVLLGFVILPLLISSMTPFRYWDVLKACQGALITAFATGKLIIVLPILIEETERLFKNYQEESADESVPAIDVLYPLAYPFPHLGKVLSMLFIPFAAWFLGSPMPAEDYPQFLSTGLFAYFGGPVLATPFLLEQAHLPHDMFQLFLLSGVYCERLGDALGAMHLMAFTILTTCAFTGHLQIRLLPILKLTAGSVGIFVVMMLGMQYYLSATLQLANEDNHSIMDLELLSVPASVEVFEDAVSNPDDLEPNESILQRIRRRGKLRVGYNDDSLPFALINHQNHLVGYDIDMAHALANDLGVDLEFVKFTRNRVVQQLNDDDFDLVMSGLMATVERSEAMTHTDPYMNVTLALMVLDHRARDFRSREVIARQEGLKVGYFDLSRGFLKRMQEKNPGVEFVKLDTAQEFFVSKSEEIDAMLISAESGSAYSMLHPKFQVVVPQGSHVSIPLYYGVGNRDSDMREFLENWIMLRTKDGTMQEKYDHWILGKNQSVRPPRWSILRNVLKWEG
ncbi:MAG: cation:dicarboxylate symporter family transporter [Pirellulales bacterium]